MSEPAFTDERRRCAGISTVGSDVHVRGTGI
jgi:hypothetical protein